MMGPPRLPVVARILPGNLRKRVFAPAYYDALAMRAAAGKGKAWAGLRAAGLVLDTLRVGIPRFAWLTLRRSRRLQLALLVILVFLVTVILRLGADYGTPPRY